MIRTEILLLVAGMMLATYLPRALPLIFVNRIRLSKKVEKFLKLIPYTVMAALICPGAFTVDANPLIGVIGAGTAALLAIFKCPVMVCVIGAIAADMIIYLVI